MNNNADKNILKVNGKVLLLIRSILTVLIIAVAVLGFLEVIPGVVTIVSLMIIGGVSLLFWNWIKM